MNWFQNLLSRGPNKHKATRSDRRSRRVPLSVELLEDRQLLTGGVVAGALSSAAALGAHTPPNPLAAAQALDLVKVPRQVLAEVATPATTSHLYSFHLEQNDRIEIDVQTAADVHLTALLSVLDNHGTVLASQTNGSPTILFQAPAAGTYYVNAAASARAGILKGPIAPSAYSLDLHRLALAQGQQDPNTLQTTGAMYAWLSGNTLDITGPTGYGFGVTGNWKEMTSTGPNGLVSATYTATGPLTLNTAAGPITLDPAASSVTLTTAPRVNGQVFGTVSGMDIPVTVNTGKMVSGAAKAFGFNLDPLNENVHFDLKLGGPAGVGLGSSPVLQASQALVDKAIPYLYFTINPLGCLNLLSVVFDPADPALFVEAGVKGLPLGPLEVNGVGFSQRGLIPYKPVDAPSQFAGQLGGNLLLQGSVDTTGLTTIPSKVTGDVVLNFDPNHTGKIFGGAGVSVADFVSIFQGHSNAALAQNLGQVFHNLSVGINGTLAISFEQMVQDGSWWLGNEILESPVSPNGALGKTLNYVNNGLGNPNSVAGGTVKSLTYLPIGHASLIYDGPTGSFYFRGGTMNPFTDGPLAKLAPLYTFLTKGGVLPTYDLDCAVKPGDQFYLDLASTYNLAGLPQSSDIKVENNWPTTVVALSKGPNGLPVPTSKTVNVSGIFLDYNVSLFGATVDLRGQAQWDGDFDLTASASVRFAGLTWSETVDLLYTHAAGLHFSAGLHGSYQSDYVRANLDVTFTLGINNGGITYSGRGSADCDVYESSLFGWHHVGDVAVWVSNHDLGFSVDGKSVDLHW